MAEPQGGVSRAKALLAQMQAQREAAAEAQRAGSSSPPLAASEPATSTVAQIAHVAALPLPPRAPAASASTMAPTSLSGGAASASSMEGSRVVAGLQGGRRSSKSSSFAVGSHAAAPLPLPSLDSLSADELRVELGRARKHKEMLTTEMEYLKGALEQQRTLATNVIAEKEQVVSRAQLLSRELIEANKANDAALRRMLLASSGPQPSDGDGRDGRAHRPSTDGRGVHSRSGSYGSLALDANGQGGSFTQTPNPPVPRERSGDISLTSAASQILMLRKEVKFAQKQWALTRRERDALRSTQSESQKAAAKELAGLRAESLAMRARLGEEKATQALLGRELLALRHLLKYRANEGQADAVLAALLLASKPGGGKAKVGLLVTGVDDADNEGGVEGGEDEEELPTTKEDALALVRSLRTDLHSTRVSLALTKDERKGLSERLLKEQEERVRLINELHDQTTELARVKGGDASSTSTSWAAKFKMGSSRPKSAQPAGDKAALSVHVDADSAQPGHAADGNFPQQATANGGNFPPSRPSTDSAEHSAAPSPARSNIGASISAVASLASFDGYGYDASNASEAPSPGAPPVLNAAAFAAAGVAPPGSGQSAKYKMNMQMPAMPKFSGFTSAKK